MSIGPDLLAPARAGFLSCLLLAAGSVSVCAAQSDTAANPDPIAQRAADIPADFTSFEVPGHTTETEALRDLYWNHYKHLRPIATLWDEWLLPPLVAPAHKGPAAAAEWRSALAGRHIDSEGYVATHQHHSIAHQFGWPFPFWNQGGGRGFGWHFSYHNTIGSGWRHEHVTKPEEWTTTGVESLGVQEKGWAFRLTAPGATMAPASFSGDAYQVPFIQVRWQAKDLGSTSTPYLEWTSPGKTDFAPERRFYMAPPAGDDIAYTMVPMYRHPEWKGDISSIRLCLGNHGKGAEIILQGLFAQYDTRHNINNPSYVSACVDHFAWTGDLNFLRDNIERVRLAMRYMESEFGTAKDGIVTTPWIGHEGTTGLRRDTTGPATMLHGRGVGNNYWDLLPFGKQDAYATIRHYGAALKMAQLEEALAANPGWNVPPSPLAASADHWRQQAAMAKENGNRLFWNADSGRFTLGIDGEGNQADYGYTFLNLEAIAYDFATEDHARQIMEWISGRRIVEKDTSKGADIYHWRFAPRATTLRNIDHYGWFWNSPEHIPFGGQVQDGGAVMGFSYHDLMARIRTLGPDDAAQRLQEIMAWYLEVTAEGGYRAYYAKEKNRGSLQGGGTAGGLGIDEEFHESILLPHTMLAGFCGFEPTPGGLSLTPRLPGEWPSLTVGNVFYRGNVISVTVTRDTVTLKLEEGHERVGTDLLKVWVASPTAAESTAKPAPAPKLWGITEPLVLNY